MHVMIHGAIGVRMVSVTKDNCAKIYTVILQCVGKKQIFAKSIGWEVPKMVGLLGEYRIKVMLGRCVLVERKMREWLKKILEKQNMYLLGSNL